MKNFFINFSFKLKKKNTISIWYKHSQQFDSCQSSSTKHLFLTGRLQSGCGLTRITFSPRMNSWLTWRVWTRPYFCEAFRETLFLSCWSSPVSDWTVLVTGATGLITPSFDLCFFADSSSPEFSWRFSFSKSCRLEKVTLVGMDRTCRGSRGAPSLFTLLVLLLLFRKCHL